MIESKVDCMLESCKNLLTGWDGYSASPPMTTALLLAKQFLMYSISNGLIPSRVSPSVIGGIGITYRKNSKKVYVEFNNNGRCCLVIYLDEINDDPTISSEDISSDFTSRILSKVINLFEN